MRKREPNKKRPFDRLRDLRLFNKVKVIELVEIEDSTKSNADLKTSESLRKRRLSFFGKIENKAEFLLMKQKYFYFCGTEKDNFVS